jgi:hypothetical protein
MQPPVRSVHNSIKAFWWHITVQPMKRGMNEILGVGWLQHQTFQGFDDISTQICDSTLVIVIPSHNLESV